jgi:hypothetical protein
MAICDTISCQARSPSILSAHPMTMATRCRHHTANAGPEGGSAMDIIWEELAGESRTPCIWCA